MAGSMNSPPGGSRPLRLSVLLPLLHPAVYTERVLVLLDRALHADGYARASAEAILAPVSDEALGSPPSLANYSSLIAVELAPARAVQRRAWRCGT